MDSPANSGIFPFVIDTRLLWKSAAYFETTDPKISVSPSKEKDGL